MKSTCYIDALPNNILEEIFLVAFAPSITQWSHRKGRSENTLCRDRTTYCLASQGWNDMICRLPRLWSDIVVSNETQLNDPNPSASYLATWFSRAANAPLDIILDLNNNKSQSKAYNTCLFQLIEANISCIRSLSIYMINGYCGLSSLPFHAASQLEHLEVNINWAYLDTCEVATKNLALGLAAAPKLTDFSITPCNETVALNLLDSGFTFEHLVNINLHAQDLSLKNFLQIMQRFAQAEEVAFHVGFLSGDNTHSNNNVTNVHDYHIHLPNLRHLHLSLLTSDYQVLKAFNLPNIQTLAISSHKSDSNIPHSMPLYRNLQPYFTFQTFFAVRTCYTSWSEIPPIPLAQSEPRHNTNCGDTRFLPLQKYRRSL